MDFPVDFGAKLQFFFFQQSSPPPPRRAPDQFCMTSVKKGTPGGYGTPSPSSPSAPPPPHSAGPPTRRALRHDEGGFECQGEKTRFATLQKQRLFAELRDTKAKNQVQSKPSIAHSSVVEKPSLVDKSWATNCFYLVKSLSSGQFFLEVA